MKTRWLDPLERRLGELSGPVRVFFRDDDVGWQDDRLRALLDLFARAELPLDLAVIPRALGSRMARELRERADDSREPLGLHQHGFAHENRERHGRSSEFGSTRSPRLQRRDIREGKRRLRELLGWRVDPFFTPPWNRCSLATGAILREEGFSLLSRDVSAKPLEIASLCELPVHLDWFKSRGGTRLPLSWRGESLANQIHAGGWVGVMLHHARMDAAERASLRDLLSLLGSSAKAQPRLLRALVPPALPRVRRGLPSGVSA